MKIRLATPDDLPLLRSLLAKSSRAFLNTGYEDLPGLLRSGVTALGEDRRGNPWGFVAFFVEERLTSLPADAPRRAFLRAAAHQRQLFADRPLVALLHTAVEAVGQAMGQGAGEGGEAFACIALTDLGWLNGAMSHAGFEKQEEIRFYLRTQQELPPVNGPALLRPITPEDLSEVAHLDSQAFAAIWHMGQAELMQLCLSARMQVARHQGRIVGYSATALRPSPNGEFGPDAQIVRLAVAPWIRRMGIGRQLLTDAIAYAHAAGITRIELNTQESNHSSQRLYESFGFRRQGKNVPVMVRGGTG